MLGRRVEEMAPHVEYAGRHAHTNFIADFFRLSKSRAKVILNNLYLSVRPHAHDLVSNILSRLYKLSSWSAREFLKFYNFIQGRKVLKNSGKTSIFIRDIASVKSHVKSR